MEALVSIIVPIYNVEKYLRTCLDSILADCYENKEIILVDDGSPDLCPAICDEYANRDPRIKVIHKQNGGVMSAWKTGFLNSRGQYICGVDPDDFVVLNMFFKIMEKVLKYQVDCLICGFWRIYPDKRLESPSNHLNLNEGVYIGQAVEAMKSCLYGNTSKKERGLLPARWNKCFKREILENNLKYADERISFGDDDCIITPTILDCKKIYLLNEPLYNYSIRENSITTQKFNLKEIDNALLLCENIVNMLKEKGYYSDFNRYANFSYHIVYLIKKIMRLHCEKRQKKEYLNQLKNHALVCGFDLQKSKRLISKRRYVAIKLLKSRFYWIFAYLK